LDQLLFGVGIKTDNVLAKISILAAPFAERSFD